MVDFSRAARDHRLAIAQDGQEYWFQLSTDRCIESLIQLTGHDENYRPEAPPEDRFAAIERWKAWWGQKGEAEYAKAHPEVRRVLDQAKATTSEVDPATLPAVVDVAVPDHAAVRYQVPRADATALLRQQKIVTASNAGDSRLRFTSTETASQWFAKPLFVAPKAAPQGRKRLEALEGKRLLLGDDGSEWFWDWDQVPLADVKRRVEEGVVRKGALINGAQVVLVDRRQRVWLIPTGAMETLLRV